jgi:hypothetical protein
MCINPSTRGKPPVSNGVKRRSVSPFWVHWTTQTNTANTARMCGKRRQRSEESVGTRGTAQRQGLRRPQNGFTGSIVELAKAPPEQWRQIRESIREPIKADTFEIRQLTLDFRAASANRTQLKSRPGCAAGNALIEIDQKDPDHVNKGRTAQVTRRVGDDCKRTLLNHAQSWHEKGNEI